MYYFQTLSSTHGSTVQDGWKIASKGFGSVDDALYDLYAHRDRNATYQLLLLRLLRLISYVTPFVEEYAVIMGPTNLGKEFAIFVEMKADEYLANRFAA